MLQLQPRLHQCLVKHIKFKQNVHVYLSLIKQNILKLNMDNFLLGRGHIVVNGDLHLLVSKDLLQHCADFVPFQAIDATAYTWYGQFINVVLQLDNKLLR